MARFRVSKLLATVGALALSGCPDPDGSVNNFVDRSEPFRPGGDRFPDAAPTAGFFDASGSYLLAIAASVDASKPLLFQATVTVAGDPPTIKVDLQAVTADAARTAVGEPLIVDAVPLNPVDGTFSVNYGRVVIAGEADPIIPGAPIEADLILNGQTQSVTEICGKVAGAIIQPAMLPLEGDFGTNPAAIEDFPGLLVSSKCGGQAGGGEGGAGGGEGGAGGVGGAGGAGGAHTRRRRRRHGAHLRERMRSRGRLRRHGRVLPGHHPREPRRGRRGLRRGLHGADGVALRDPQPGRVPGPAQRGQRRLGGVRGVL